MAQYTNLTSLAGLNVGDVVTYTTSNLNYNVETAGVSATVRMDGGTSCGLTIADVDFANIPNITIANYSALYYGLHISYGTFTTYASLLYYRFLVTGGNGDSSSTYSGATLQRGSGGGLTGGGTSYSNGASLTSGGSASSGNAGRFGYGGSHSYEFGPISIVSTGGYGWYGGGAAADSGGAYSAGGSGFVIGTTTTTYPSGYMGGDASLISAITSAVTNGSTTLAGSGSTKQITLTITGAGTVKYPISTVVVNGTYSGDTEIEENGTATVTISPNVSYLLPSSVYVEGALYSYNSSTGIISLYNPTGNVTISVTCTKNGYINYYDSAQSDFVKCEPHYYNGTEFIKCEPQYYDGTEWRLLE